MEEITVTCCCCSCCSAAFPIFLLPSKWQFFREKLAKVSPSYWFQLCFWKADMIFSLYRMIPTIVAKTQGSWLHLQRASWGSQEKRGTTGQGLQRLGRQPLATCGYWALERWLVWRETCWKSGPLWRIKDKKE